MKRMLLLVIALIVTASALASGCVGVESLDRNGYVMSIGFDEGETCKYLFTFMMQKVDIESSAKKKGGFLLVSAEGNGLFEAIETISGNLPYKIDFSRTSLFIFTRSLAEKPGEMQKLMDVSMDKLAIRQNVNLFISLGPAKDALAGMENDFDPNLSKLQMNFVTYSEDTGLIPVANLSMFYESANTSCYDIVLPLCGVTSPDRTVQQSDSVGTRKYAYVGGRLLVESDMKTGLAGAALFREGQMVGILDGQHTQMLLLAIGDFTQGSIQITAPDGLEVCVFLKMNDPPMRTIQLSDSPRAKVTVRMSADIEMPEAVVEYSPKQLEEIIEDAITLEMYYVFEAMKRLRTDPFGFGKLAVMQFSDTKAWESYDWPAAYQRLEVAFHADVKLIHNTGKSVWE